VNFSSLHQKNETERKFIVGNTKISDESKVEKIAYQH
jgi:hypothetical protein